MRFHCLVSRSRTRAPLTSWVAADDEAMAAWCAWVEAGHRTTAWVHQRGPGRWVATDGHNVVRVQILSADER